MPPPPGPVPSRTYVPGPFTRIFISCSGLGLLIFGWGPILALLSSPSSPAHQSARGKAAFDSLGILFGCAGIVLSAIAFRFMKRALRAKAVWSRDSIELFGRRGYQLIRIAEIIGRRNVREERGWNVELISRDKNMKKFVLPMDWVLPFDSDFKKWIRAIPETNDTA
jgi:hypothetical protein